MKHVSVIISTVLLCGIFAVSGCNAQQNKSNSTPNTEAAAPTSGARIAYVNVDTLEEHYEYLKEKTEEFKKNQDDMEAELQRSYQQMQNDAADVQKKAQANTLSQSEYEAAQKRLMQMQQSLETRKQALTEQLVKAQDVFNKSLKARLDSCLEDYNKDKHYDYILSYTSSGSGAILLANKQLDITWDVVKRMNDISKNEMEKKNK